MIQQVGIVSLVDFAEFHLFVSSRLVLQLVRRFPTLLKKQKYQLKLTKNVNGLE